MKTILVFDMPEEQEEFDTVNKAFDNARVVSEIHTKLRHYRKYHEWKSVTERRFFEKLDAEFLEVLKERE